MSSLITYSRLIVLAIQDDIQGISITKYTKYMRDRYQITGMHSLYHSQVNLLVGKDARVYRIWVHSRYICIHVCLGVIMDIPVLGTVRLRKVSYLPQTGLSLVYTVDYNTK